MAKRFIVPNISSLCTTYRTDLLYAVRNNNEIKDYINRKCSLAKPGDISQWTYVFSNKARWIEMMMRMSPKRYNKGSIFLRYDLLEKQEEQVKFADKVLPKIEKLNFDDQAVMGGLVAKYGLFLTLCLKNPNSQIVPSLIEDFVWHSHMTDPRSYKDMTTSMFGRILDHRTDINLEKATNESQIIRENFLKSYGIQSDSSFGTFGTIAMAGMAGMAVTSAMHSQQYHHSQQNDQQPKQQQTDNSSSSVSSCGGDLMGFGPNGILNPINPWNSVNPLSPYHHHGHHGYGSISHSSNNEDNYIDSSNDVSDSSGSDSSSSCSSSSCSSSSCGSSCGGGD